MYGSSSLITGRNEVVAKVMFLLVSVILCTGGVSASVHAGIPPPADTHSPPEQTTPWEQTPPQEQTNPPLTDTHPPGKQTPPGVDSSIRSMSGRYASYWNAFLLKLASTTCNVHSIEFFLQNLFR